MIVQNTNDNTEKIISSVENIPIDTEIIIEKRVRGQRGPDKMPRKVNLNSINNLKQYGKNTEKTHDNHSMIQHTISNPSSKLFVGLAIFFVLVILVIMTWYLFDNFQKYRRHNI